MKIRNDWTIEELKTFYSFPLFELISYAHQIHRQFHPLGEIQICTLISVKTGGCPENCKYCSQSSYYQTPVKAQAMMSYDDVLEKAKQAKDSGATRICLGAAWREVRNGKPFDEMLRMVRGITALGLEVCCTLGMLNPSQAKKLKEAGLYAYNHNLDSSENYYKSVVTTRTYQDRLKTLEIIQSANISVCCGGIMGMGETAQDRLELLHALATRNPQPDSVPINRLEPVIGTPLSSQPPVTSWEIVRLVAIARVIMPKTMVRLSAGRLGMTFAEQALCFFAGANSIHMGEKLLTVGNHTIDQDAELFHLLGLKKLLFSKVRYD